MVASALRASSDARWPRERRRGERWEGIRPPERESGVAWRPHGIMRSSNDWGATKHSYRAFISKCFGECDSSVHSLYCSSRVPVEGPRVHRGNTGGAPRTPGRSVRVRARARSPRAAAGPAAARGGASAELHSSRLAPRGAGGRLGPSFITSYLRSLPRAVPAARAPGGSAADFRGDRLCLSPLAPVAGARHGLHSDSLRD